MLIITIIYSLITILGVGSILNPIMKRCDVLSKKGSSTQEISDISGEKKRCCASFKNFIVNFNQQYFAPIFIRSQQLPARKGFNTDASEVKDLNPIKQASEEDENNWTINQDTEREME